MRRFKAWGAYYGTIFLLFLIFLFFLSFSMGFVVGCLNTHGVFR